MGKIPWNYVAASYPSLGEDNLGFDLGMEKVEEDLADLGRLSPEESLRRLGKKSLGGRVRF